MSWLFGCGHHRDEDESFRSLDCNEGPANKAAHKYVNNEIHTSKYNLLTFWPKARAAGGGRGEPSGDGRARRTRKLQIEKRG